HHRTRRRRRLLACFTVGRRKLEKQYHHHRRPHSPAATASARTNQQPTRLIDSAAPDSVAQNSTDLPLLPGGLLAFAGAGMAFPFYMAAGKSKPVIDSSKPLPPQATFRGPYVNTGSRDIGPDFQSYPKK
ncbi:unnamed protein product, partial [Linum tenue]